MTSVRDRLQFRGKGSPSLLLLYFMKVDIGHSYVSLDNSTKALQTPLPSSYTRDGIVPQCVPSGPGCPGKAAAFLTTA